MRQHQLLQLRRQHAQVTDPAGKWKDFTMDAFGNLTKVISPIRSTSQRTLTTSYAYDILNHFTR